MSKILLTIVAFFGLVFRPGMTDEAKIQNHQIRMQNTEISTEVSEVVEEEWVESVYTYEDEGGVYTFTLKSEEEVLIEVTSESGTNIKLTTVYTLSDNLLTITVDGEVFEKFVVTENSNELTLFEEPVEDVPSDEPTVDDILPEIDTEENLNETVENLKLLVEALKAELEAETFNAENLAKIIIALLGAFGSLGLILLFKLLKAKIRNLKNDEEYQKAKEEMAKQFAQYQSEIRGQFASLENKVCKKIDETEAQRQKEAEAQSLKLRESVETAKKNLDINKVLDD